MTYEEAIKHTKAFLEIYDLFNDDRIAIEKGIEALEKQIPKKPDIEGDGYWNGELVYDTWICPCCGEHYEIEFEKYKYCPECGQAVDLSKVE